MESFGEYLKTLREEKGLSLEELSERTKIALTNLGFLEADRFDLLPPRVYVKGFIRSYVTELGLAPDEAVNRFDAYVKEGELPDYEADEHPLFKPRPLFRSLVSGAVFTTALTAAGAVALVILVVTGASRLFYWGEEKRGSAPVVASVGPSPGYKAPAGGGQEGRQPDVSAFNEPPKTQAGRKVLEIKATAKAWVRVESDGAAAEEFVMTPGDVQIFTAKEGFCVQTGNAGGIRLRFERRELPVLGKENQTLSLTLP